ncbi:hypothetical protein M9435_001965 [Picochlorum sp. BPE23]|nr:hypothetical protein M9435_001965 [Picochlorum sp. BPE23]
MTPAIAGRTPRPTGPFDPPIGRKTSIIVLKKVLYEGKDDVRIVTSLSTQSSTEVFEIDSEHGVLRFASESVFTDEASALSALEKQGFQIQTGIRGSALLGFVSTETVAGVLVAVQTMPKVTLPGGHILHLVTDAQWVVVNYKNFNGIHPSVLAAEQDFWRLLQQNNVSGTHYFCESVDVSRPFPSDYASFHPDQEFVWNSWLSKPFRDLGLLRHCPCLLQGAVESADQVHVNGERYTITTISRRSRRHPGTRYLARGLNQYAGPGNEIEVESIVWKSAEGKCVDWCRVFWRRGTVPIWWGVEIQPLNKGLHAEVYVREEKTYVGSLTYFKSLLGRAAHESHGGHEEGKDTLNSYLSSSESQEAVTCINLLHCNPKKAAELLLSSHFQEGMRHVKERLGSHGGSSLRLLNFDWHGTMACLTEEKGVEAFWHFIEQPVKAVGFAAGSMRSRDAVTDCQDESLWGDHWKMCWTRRQKGLLRFNCADSLDRTNAASCFAILPVLQESLRHLGIQLDMVDQSAENSKLQALPPGWEVREHEGRPLYIDHNTKKTQWERPSMPQSSPKATPWQFFTYSLGDVRSRLYPDVINDYITMFRKHGDVHSELYTGSAAMHSHILGVVLPNDTRSYGSASSVGKLQNLKVAVQRRWNNTVSDAPRQQSIEMFLGLNISRHCPGLSMSCLDGTHDDAVFQSIVVAEDENELAESKTISNLGEELRALGLKSIKKHDGRLALEEDVEDANPKDPLGLFTESPPPPPPPPPDLL